MIMAKMPIEALGALVKEIEGGDYVWRTKAPRAFYTLQPTTAFKDAVETIEARDRNHVLLNHVPKGIIVDKEG